MRRIFFLIGLLILPVFSGFSEETVFRSNAVGMSLEPISEYRQDNFEYILKVKENTDSGDLDKVLLRNGAEYKRWIEKSEGDIRTITIYEEGKISEHSVYSAIGLILRNILYDSEAVIEEDHHYVYINGEIDHVIVLNVEGIELYRILYEKGKHGRLRSMTRVYPEKTVESLYKFSPDSVIEEWHGRDIEGDLFRFNASHQVVAQENWNGLSKERLSEYNYSEGNLDYITDLNFLNNIITKTWYDDNGLEVRELSESEGVLVSETECIHDEEKYLIEKRKWTPGLREKWEYTYKGEDDLETESYYKNGSKVSEIEYITESEYHEYLYRKDKPFIKIIYIDDQKVEEELLIEPARNRDD